MTKAPNPGENGRAALNGKAAASLLRRTTTTRDDPVPPCVTNPCLFDPPETGVHLREVIDRLLEAEAACYRCPLISSCEVLADGFRGVAAGKLYGVAFVPDGVPPSSVTFPIPKRWKAA
ncbi:hypothetical protein [Rhodococcus pyridinivorans]|uniref:hypothetical protein n=1 Tax=Rhodococcus pyridinivorans TaxID=103816 RepID=UPI0037C8594E